MENYFSTCGEKMPLRNAIHLPSFLTKTRVHTIMCEEIVLQNDPTLSFSRFCRLWSSEFSYVVIPPVSI